MLYKDRRWIHLIVQRGTKLQTHIFHTVRPSTPIQFLLQKTRREKSLSSRGGAITGYYISYNAPGQCLSLRPVWYFEGTNDKETQPSTGSFDLAVTDEGLKKRQLLWGSALLHQDKIRWGGTEPLTREQKNIETRNTCRTAKGGSSSLKLKVCWDFKDKLTTRSKLSNKSSRFSLS